MLMYIVIFQEKKMWEPKTHNHPWMTAHRQRTLGQVLRRTRDGRQLVQAETRVRSASKANLTEVQPGSQGSHS